MFRAVALTIFFGAIALLACCTPAEAGEEIKPPFGLQWTETSEHLAKLLKGAKASVVEKRTIDGREAWTVEGLVQAGLRRTIFYFKNESLNEVELQYENKDWDTAKYDAFMTQVRRRIEQKYGIGQLIARSNTPEGEVMQTLVGYKWNQNNTAIQLLYFSAQKGTDVYRTVSIHYKGY